MNINQVYNIVNESAKQAFGESDVSVIDYTSFVSMGDKVLSSESNTDNFLKVLVDRIAKTVVDNRTYEADDLSMLREPFEYGAVLQRVHVDYIEAKKSSQWDLTDGSSVNQYEIAKPKATQKLFSGINTWEVDVTIPDIQVKSAFLNEQAMASFIDGIFVMLETSMEVQIENSTYATTNNFICTTLNAGTDSARVRHLLTEYNTANSTTLTAEESIVNLEFLKYAVTEINKDIKRLSKFSTLYNIDGKKRFTTKEKARVLLLTDFVQSCYSYLQSSTYHKELVELPKFSEVVRWQGMGTDPTLESVSSIMMNISDGTEVTQDYVIGFVSDVDAMGVTIDNRRMKSAYNEKGEYTNFFSKADIGYFNDTSHNGIVYILD